MNEQANIRIRALGKQEFVWRVKACGPKMELVRWAGASCAGDASFSLPRTCSTEWRSQAFSAVGQRVAGPQAVPVSELEPHRWDWKVSVSKGGCVLYKFQKPVSVPTWRCMTSSCQPPSQVRGRALQEWSTRGWPLPKPGVPGQEAPPIIFFFFLKIFLDE